RGRPRARPRRGACRTPPRRAERLERLKKTSDFHRPPRWRLHRSCAVRPPAPETLAAFRRRGRAPVRGPARGHVRRHSRARAPPRHVRAVLAVADPRARDGVLPAARDRARRRRARAPCGACGREPLPETPVVPLLAPRALLNFAVWGLALVH